MISYIGYSHLRRNNGLDDATEDSVLTLLRSYRIIKLVEKYNASD